METENGIICIYIYIHGKRNNIYICCRFKWKTENGSPGDFPYPFTVCSSCKLKFVICPFVDKETNRRYPFANGLKKLNGLAYLWSYVRDSLCGHIQSNLSKHQRALMYCNQTQGKCYGCARVYFFTLKLIALSFQAYSCFLLSNLCILAAN